MRCSANGASLWHKVTFSPEKTVPQAEPTPHHRLRAELPLGGEAKVGVVPRGSPNEQVLPRIRKLSLLCTPSLSAVAPGLPVTRGGLGGRSRIEFIVSPLSRRRHNESHFAAQSPECAFLRRFRVSGFCLRSFAQAKNGVNLRRRSRKISVESHPPDKRQG